jgi:hypothetical protein
LEFDRGKGGDSWSCAPEDLIVEEAVENLSLRHYLKEIVLTNRT